MEPIQLTPEQQRALDNREGTAPRLLDPRTDTAYASPKLKFYSGQFLGTLTT